MRKLVILLILLVPLIGSAEELETIQPTPIRVNYSTSDDSALDPNTTSWTTASAWVEIPENYNGMKVQFFAYDPNDPNGNTFSYQIYGADYGNNAQLIASGSATVGGAKLSHNPITVSQLNSGAIDPNYAWVDTLGTVVTTDWGGGVSPQNDDGSDDVSALLFDRQSLKTIWCRLYSRSDSYMYLWCIAYGY